MNKKKMKPLTELTYSDLQAINKKLEKNNPEYVSKLPAS